MLALYDCFDGAVLVAAGRLLVGWSQRNQLVRASLRQHCSRQRALVAGRRIASADGSLKRREKALIGALAVVLVGSELVFAIARLLEVSWLKTPPPLADDVVHSASALLPPTN